MSRVFECDQCKTIVSHLSEFTTGYAVNEHGDKICFDCCSENDKKSMVENGHSKCCPLYLSNNPRLEGPHKFEVTNWPGTLRFRVGSFVQGEHSAFGNRTKRTDVWFRGPDGFIWWGRNMGDSDIVHCRRTKKTSF